MFKTFTYTPIDCFKNTKSYAEFEPTIGSCSLQLQKNHENFLLSAQNNKRNAKQEVCTE